MIDKVNAELIIVFQIVIKKFSSEKPSIRKYTKWKRIVMTNEYWKNHDQPKSATRGKTPIE